MSKKQKQRKIVTQVADGESVRALKRKIKLLKRLPKDFRDLDPGSRDWEAFADITDRRKEMEDWANGPTLCLKEPNTAEKMILENIVWHINLDDILDMNTNWYTVIEHACILKCSWIYLPDETFDVVAALNVILSRFGYNCRVRGQIKSERSGKPIGVVH